MTLHPFEPVCDKNSKILILGSFPSVKSRENGFYYGNGQNRFWRTLAEVLNQNAPESVKEKTDFLINNKIALWDALWSCEIDGSSDASIRLETPNELKTVFSVTGVIPVYTNGMTAHKLFQKYHKPIWGVDDVCLPSTSPANARMRQDDLTKAWSVIGKALEPSES